MSYCPDCAEKDKLIREQRDEIARLTNEISARSDLMQGYLDCWRHERTRAERAEQRIKELVDQLANRS